MNARKSLFFVAAALVLAAISLDLAPANAGRKSTTVADGTAPMPPLPRPKLAAEWIVADGTAPLPPIPKGRGGLSV